ncbi:MAG TPA: ribonuclease H [Gemmatimonadaceae bacterium]|nr:ribonuclease H [Gemmatimonadaceae bacterium]
MSGGPKYPLIAIYADESCLGNGREGSNPGGAGALIEYMRPNASEIVRRDIWIAESGTTNNRMALRSVIDSFQALSKKGKQFSVVFTSDSRYLIDGMTQWVRDWAKRGWTRKSGPIENLELWHAAVDAVRGHEVQWRWVRGHHGHPQNEYANHLATSAAAKQTASDGLVESQFDSWLASQRERGAVRNAVDAFPIADGFKAAAPLPLVSTGRL